MFCEGLSSVTGLNEVMEGHESLVPFCDLKEENGGFVNIARKPYDVVVIAI